MKFNAQTYNFLMGVMGAYFQAMGAIRGKETEPTPAPPPLLTIRGGYAESPAWYMVQAAEFDPKPLTVANLRVRDIYASETLAAALLEMLASEKWLSRRGESYYLTESGRQIIKTMQERPKKLLADLNPLPSNEMERLERLLRRIIDGSLAAPTPPGAWCLAHSRNRAPADNSLPLIKIFHYLSDFNAFRDDAHMAAFMPYEPDGYIWEAFTLIVGQTADSATTLFDQLAYRGYAEEDFAQALTHLVSRGWLGPSKSVGTFQPTAAGTEIKNKVEALTDEYFYAPWLLLTADEQEELNNLLNKLKTNLQNIN
ncbi:MAG: hypothetical protein AB8G95_26840 [Anaerolineae bacterium]